MLDQQLRRLSVTWHPRCVLFEYERSDHFSALAGHVIGSIGDAFVIAEWQDAGGPAGTPGLIAPRHRAGGRPARSSWQG
jgi:hypothetical protein